MKFILLLASAGAAMAFVECRTPSNAELFNNCQTQEQRDGCKGQCIKHCSDTTANLAVCINKANNDFDCVCATQAGRGPGFN
ncbi:hypothetical protein CSIM01_01532 [Colletotrichum simmondsii]|uniref:Uncharacterized protein n=2 Tax=Colletotrichum acutatum species complex TaxID=2707335 RepID=A0A135TR67_9PEZI|nr:hypothetical protein CSIM01_01532 [Colletotrichum simmondsii]